MSAFTGFFYYYYFILDRWKLLGIQICRIKLKSVLKHSFALRHSKATQELVFRTTPCKWQIKGKSTTRFLSILTTYISTLVSTWLLRYYQVFNISPKHAYPLLRASIISSFPRSAWPVWTHFPSWEIPLVFSSYHSFSKLLIIYLKLRIIARGRERENLASVDSFLGWLHPRGLGRAETRSHDPPDLPCIWQETKLLNHVLLPSSGH